MKKEIKVQGMSCGHCVKSVTEIISEIKGVTSVEVSLANASASLEFDEDEVSVEEILDTVNDTHFKASL